MHLESLGAVKGQEYGRKGGVYGKQEREGQEVGFQRYGGGQEKRGK